MKLFRFLSRKKRSSLASRDASTQAVRADNYDNLRPLSLDHELATVEPKPKIHVESEGLGIVARAPDFGNKKETG